MYMCVYVSIYIHGQHGGVVVSTLTSQQFESTGLTSKGLTVRVTSPS